MYCCYIDSSEVMQEWLITKLKSQAYVSLANAIQIIFLRFTCWMSLLVLENSL